MFREPFSLEGRIRRKEYVISFVIFFAFINLLGILTDLFAILELLYIPLVWFIIAQGTKRCHDKNKEGWYQIVPFYLFALFFSEGDKEQNKFGENPK